MTAFMFFIDNSIIQYIVNCTQIEAQLKLQDKTWTTKKIGNIIGIMIAQGLLAKRQSVDQIWSKTWDSLYFHQTMARNRYKDLLRFIRFDIKSARSARLKTDKFALFS